MIVGAAALVVIVVLAVVGLSLSGSSSGDKAGYCAQLSTLAKAGGGIGAGSGSATPTPAAIAHVQDQVNALENAAPSSIKGVTTQWAGDANQLLALFRAGKTPNSSSGLGTALAMAGLESQMVTWGQANCPAGTIPSLGSGSSGSGSGSGSSSGGSSSTSTTQPAKTLTVSGGGQALIGTSGAAATVAVSKAIVNPPMVAGTDLTQAPFLALYVTVANTGSTSIDLGSVNYSVDSSTSGGGGNGTVGDTSLGASLSSNSLDPGSSASGWVVVSADASGGAQTISLGFGNLTAGTWTAS